MYIPAAWARKEIRFGPGTAKASLWPDAAKPGWGTKVELIVNLKAAKPLGIVVPTSLLGRADQVIE